MQPWQPHAVATQEAAIDKQLVQPSNLQEYPPLDEEGAQRREEWL